ncbi:Ig-like domain-containing protein [Paenibacillus sp. XY044]|uniref:Ig-like domain-containing protein n=1 Tax=Paenibacillus sp. XY044 TaxID=2026089 RepID=UPI000B998B19|nr:Ig-like domain-containing protein [Paenibacillus sp. XY044]OZB98024.1 hypothetical protein CJP46_02335 [Paenibacillus sp. XY044]
MSYKDKYKLRDEMYGANIRDIRVNVSEQNLNSVFKESPVYYQVVDVDSNDKYDLQITDNSDAKDTKDFIAPFHSSIIAGRTVEWKNDKWIVIHYDENSEVYKSGILRKCLSTLKWLDSAGDVQETWFTYTTTALSNFGIQDGKIINLDNERRQLTIQNNTHTSLFTKGRRFVFDGRAWKISAIDRLEDNLIYLVLDADAIDPSKDNVELRIADYVKPNYSIQLDQTNISLKVGDTFIPSVTVTNNGTPLLSPTLSFVSSDPDICTVDELGLITGISDGQATVTVGYKDVYMIIEVTISVVESHNYSVMINGDTTITKSKSKSYNCVFCDNGTEVHISGLFRLTDLNGNSTSSAIITSQSNNACSVRGDSIGYVLLHVESDDGLISSSKQIQIKSAI